MLTRLPNEFTEQLTLSHQIVAAIAATTTFRVAKAQGRARIDRVEMVWSAQVTQDATNYYKIDVKKGSTVIASWSFQTSAQGTLAADTFADLVKSRPVWHTTDDDKGVQLYVVQENGVKLPVIAAGGIADAAGVRAAMALGAAGVQAGTAYLCCPEATTSALHRAALMSEAARHTELTTLFSGRPARGIVNRLMRELGSLSPAAPAFPLATAAVAPLRAHFEARGRTDCTPLWSGQNASGCQAVPAADITAALARGFDTR